jgi:hypothetical protein
MVSVTYDGPNDDDGNYFESAAIAKPGYAASRSVRLDQLPARTMSFNSISVSIR